MIKAALIGVSGYASLYLKNLIRLQENGVLDLEAVLIKNPDEHEEEAAFIKANGADIFSDSTAFFEAIANKGVELCCIPTSIYSHAHLSLEAMKAGCHVLVEKPAAATVADIDKMLEGAKEYDRKVFVGYQDIYHESIWHIKRLILEGVIGELQSLSLLGLWPRSMAYFTRNEWAGKLKLDDHWIYDSVLHNAFGHFLNLMCFWAGSEPGRSAEVDKVSGNLYRTMPIESFDTCSIKVRTTSGKNLLAHLSHSSKNNVDPEIRILGTRGSIEWQPASYKVNGELFEVANNTAESLSMSRTTMFDNVVEILHGKEKHCCSLEIARVPTQIANLLHAELPITSLSNGLVSTYENELGKHLAITGLEELMNLAHHKHSLMQPLVLNV